MSLDYAFFCVIILLGKKEVVWKMLKKTGISDEERFYLCTDFPKEAEDFLN